MNTEIPDALWQLVVLKNRADGGFSLSKSIITYPEYPKGQ